MSGNSEAGLVALFCILLVGTSAGVQYKSAVVEYAIGNNFNIDENIKNYVQLIENASKDKVDIVVFPESTLNDPQSTRKSNVETAFLIPEPNESAAPCDSDEYHEALTSISCQSRSSRLYVVINVSEKVKCSNNTDGYRLYNTNIVFDRDGNVVSRYRKTHRSETPSGVVRAETFRTDFDVTFGHLIGSDLMFDVPFGRMKMDGVRNFVAPMRWQSRLPFLTGGSDEIDLPTDWLCDTFIQEAWAHGNDVNLLAAGVNGPESSMSGSGVYSGRRGSKTSLTIDGSATHLITAVVDSENYISYDKPNTKHTERNINVKKMKLHKSNLTNFTWKPINMSARNHSYQEICYGQFCCEVYTKVTRTKESKYKYKAIAYEGAFDIPNSIPMDVQICSLVACTGNSIETCGEILEKDVGVQFEDVLIRGTFVKDNAMHFPLSLTDQLTPLARDMYSYHVKQNEFDSLDIELKTVERLRETLLTFGVMTSVSMKYPAEDFAVNSSVLQMDEMVVNIPTDTFGYVFGKLQIISLIVVIYVLEMM